MLYEDRKDVMMDIIATLIDGCVEDQYDAHLNSYLMLLIVNLNHS